MPKATMPAWLRRNRVTTSGQGPSEQYLTGSATGPEEQPVLSCLEQDDIKRPTSIALIDEAISRQQAAGGHAGAEFLFGVSGLHPELWGVSKAQLQTFREEVSAAIASGEISGQNDPSLPFYYPQWKFDDPTYAHKGHLDWCA